MVTNCTSNYHTESLKVSLIIFYLNMVDYPVFFPMLSTLTCDTQWPISDSSEANSPLPFSYLAWDWTGTWPWAFPFQNVPYYYLNFISS